MTTTWIRKTFRLEEACTACGVEQQVVLEWIRKEWISPAEPGAPALDDEDIARVRLIATLRGELGVNDEGIPVILHLLDQLHHLRSKLKS